MFNKSSETSSADAFKFGAKSVGASDNTVFANGSSSMKSAPASIEPAFSFDKQQNGSSSQQSSSPFSSGQQTAFQQPFFAQANSPSPFGQGKAFSFGPQASSVSAKQPTFLKPSSTLLQADSPTPTSSKRKVTSSDETDNDRTHNDSQKRHSPEKPDEAAILAERQRKATAERNRVMLRNAFANIGRIERDEMVKSVVSEIVQEVSSKTLEEYVKERKRDERARLVESLAAELFTTLVYDNSWQACQEAMAGELRRRYLLKATLKKISMAAVLAKANADLKKRRREQYLEASRMLGRPAKKKRMSSSHMPVDNYLSEAERIALIDEEREEVQQLWRPLDLDAVFLKHVDLNFESAGILDGVLDVNVLTSDWHSPAGVWMRKKLALEWDGNRYIHNLQGKSVNVTFASMDANPDSYDDVGALIFLCGASGSHESFSSHGKLSKDRETLQEALRRLRQFSSYGVTLLVCYWPFEGISSAEVCIIFLSFECARKLTVAYRCKRS